MTSPPGEPSPTLERALAEPIAFALLQWPALLLALHDPAGQPLRFGAGVVWLAMSAAAYAGGRGLGFGNAMTACSACVAAAWWLHPSAWALAWGAPLLLLVLAAQRLRVRRVQ